MSDDYTHGDNLPDPWGDAIEIEPTMKQLNDPYVLQLIARLGQQDDEIERLRAALTTIRDDANLCEGEGYYADVADKALKGVESNE